MVILWLYKGYAYKKTVRYFVRRRKKEINVLNRLLKTRSY